MTRKHFEAIARTIAHTPIPYDARVQVAMDMADSLRQFNGSFQRDRFLRACGVNR